MTNRKGLVRWGREWEGRVSLFPYWPPMELVPLEWILVLPSLYGSQVTISTQDNGKVVINNSDSNWCQRLGIFQGRDLPSLGAGYPLSSHKTGQLWERNGLRI